MEAFSALLALCEGNPPVIGGFPSQRPVTQSFEFFLTNGWADNRDAGDLKRNRAHYDVTVMYTPLLSVFSYCPAICVSLEAPHEYLHQTDTRKALKNGSIDSCFARIDFTHQNLRVGPTSLRWRSSYRMIISFEARFRFKIFQSLCNLTGVSTSLLLMSLSNCRSMQWFQQTISTASNLTRSQ